MRVVVAVTGASGVVVGYRLAELLAGLGHEVLGLETSAAQAVRRAEAPGAGFAPGTEVYLDHDQAAPLNSSSYLFDAMVIAPCSMKTLAALAAGYAESLVVRAADTALRMGRRLVVAPRETPLSASALENMLRLRRDGALIAPLMMAYYVRPASVDEVTDFLAGKLLDLLGVEHALYRRWPPEPSEDR